MTYQITFLFLNIQSLRNKCDELEVFVNDTSGSNLFSVIGITEHWLRSFEMEHCNIDNYMIPSYFCRQGLGYGGSLIMTHQSLECRILTQITDLSVEKICELSAIKSS